jgi:hypothetical protein
MYHDPPMTSLMKKGERAKSVEEKYSAGVSPPLNSRKRALNERKATTGRTNRTNWTVLCDPRT